MRAETMHKLWLIARREYVKCTRTKSFLLLTLGLPLAIVAVVGIAIVFSNRGPVTVGYVDEAGIIANSAPAVVTASGESVGPDESKVHFQAFSDTLLGQAALSRKEIQALYILPGDYLTSGRVQGYYWSRQPSNTALEQFKLFLRANLVADRSQEIQARVLEGPKDVSMRSLDGPSPAGGGGFAGVVIPGVLALFFTFALMASVGYFLQAVTEEKENRTVEVLATSVSANQLIGGKTLGLVAVVLTQLLIWVAVAAAGLLVAVHFFPPPGELKVSGWFLVVAVLYFVPSFVLAAGMVISIGAAVSDFQQGQQITGVLTLLFLLPIFFVALVFQNPDSPILVFFTLFPTTSLATVAFRWGATVIPFWQLAAGWLLLTLSATGMVVLAPRIFRRGMLHYGTRMSLRGALEAVRAKAV
jgi:ABC-2 type transport system permease protein